MRGVLTKIKSIEKKLMIDSEDNLIIFLDDILLDEATQSDELSNDLDTILNYEDSTSLIMESLRDKTKPPVSVLFLYENDIRHIAQVIRSKEG